MKWKRLLLNRKWLIVPPVVLGVCVVGFFAATRETPKRKPEQELAQALRVVEVPKVDLIPRVLGHGVATPGRVWRAVAEVKGRVVSVHPELKSGSIITVGDELLRIDPTEYELAVARLKADIQQTTAQIAQLQVRVANDQASLKLEEQSLTLVEKDLKRARELIGRSATSQAELDQQERNTLVQQQKIQALRNSLNLLPEERKALEAVLEARKVALAQAEIDLKKTVIVAPFEGRLGEVEIEVGQFLAGGQTLFEVYGMATTEIEVEVPLQHVARLLRAGERPSSAATIEERIMQIVQDLKIWVQLRDGDFLAQWEGRFARFREQIDPQTRSVGLVVAVDDTYEKAVPGVRPPLVKGAYCEVELRGPARKGRLIIPRSSLRDGIVYVVDAQNRLSRRTIEVESTQFDTASVTQGLREGEMVVVSGSVPAIEGMLVEPAPDSELRQVLIAEATSNTEETTASREPR
jgi:RND family efflux transporter MFP subunit